MKDAKGHGSAAHQAGVARVPSPEDTAVAQARVRLDALQRDLGQRATVARREGPGPALNQTLRDHARQLTTAQAALAKAEHAASKWHTMLSSARKSYGLQS